MPEKYKIVAKVVSQKGHCEAKHVVGEEFVIDDVTPLHMCSWAFYTIFPFYSALKFGGSFPWEKDSDAATVACPDPDNPVLFEIRRTRV
ncbi:MAG: hypothetical protein A2Z02_05610 [Chloroflexi bacterium RBG_16_48_7]|nr:MAG: hypothetical protein A2Z02_05610 [Chloroflexi bacterium RBG_16_48_7]